MKRFEIILGIIFLIALIFKIALIPGGVILATISLTLLAMFYNFFAFAFFNKIRLKNIFSGKSYQGISVWRIIGSIGLGWGLAALCMGILFKLMQWPGGMIMLLTGLITILIVVIIALVKFFLSKGDFYKTILLRIAIIGGFGLFFFFTTDLGLAIAKIQYRNHPDYIKAYERYLEKPSEEIFIELKIEKARATSKSQEEFEARKEMYEEEIRMWKEYENKRKNQ